MSAVFSDRGHRPLVGQDRFNVGRELGGAFLAVLAAAILPGLIMVALRGSDSIGSSATEASLTDAPLVVQVEGATEVAPNAVTTDIGNAAVQLAPPPAGSAHPSSPIGLSAIAPTSVDATFRLERDTPFRVEIRSGDQPASIREGTAIAGQVITASFDRLVPGTDYRVSVVLPGDDPLEVDAVWFRTASE